MNEIEIRGLEVFSRIGVPPEEREHPQRLLLDVVITPCLAFAEMDDSIKDTVDYDAAARRLVELAAERPRLLIETLATDAARMLIGEFPARSAVVQVRKFILPNTEYVAVRYKAQRTP